MLVWDIQYKAHAGRSGWGNEWMGAGRWLGLLGHRKSRSQGSRGGLGEEQLVGCRNPGRAAEWGLFARTSRKEKLLGGSAPLPEGILNGMAGKVRGSELSSDSKPPQSAFYSTPRGGDD